MKSETGNFDVRLSADVPFDLPRYDSWIDGFKGGHSERFTGQNLVFLRLIEGLRARKLVRETGS